jgi:riboflavin transporter
MSQNQTRADSAQQAVSRQGVGSQSAGTGANRQGAPIKNTNRWSTRQLVTMALMCAIGALFAFVQIPLLPAAPFLTYDPSLVPAMVCGFVFGPASGFVVGSIAAVIHGLILGEWVGSLMNICATLFFVVPAALIYKRLRTFKGAIAGLAVGCVVATLGAILANCTLGVAFWYGSLDAIVPLLLPAVVPFNIIKTILNSALTLLVYKPVSNMVTPKKNQVKGR